MTKSMIQKGWTAEKSQSGGVIFKSMEVTGENYFTYADIEKEDCLDNYVFSHIKYTQPAHLDAMLSLRARVSLN